MLNSQHFASQHWAEHIQDQIAIVWENNCDYDFLAEVNTHLSWREFDQLLKKIAKYLLYLGVSEGRHVAYIGENRFIGLLCYCATIALNARILMINPAFTDYQRQKIFIHNQIEIVITDTQFRTLDLVDALHCLPILNLQQAVTFTLSSGSSGIPKTIVHSVAQHLDNAKGVCERLSFGQENSWLLSLPIFHVSGQGIVWRWLLTGATLYVYETKDNFGQMLERVTHASLVPTQLQRYLVQLGNMHKAQIILLGGMAIPASLIQQANQHGITVYAGYGMTEMGSTISVSKNNLTSVGTVLKGREICIVDGEIWVKGAGMALGYWQNGEIIPFVNAQGWLQTKDSGYWNDNYELVVNGRIDNMFISGGENIYPEEIERVLFQSLLLKSVIVIPIWDAKFGHRPLAMVEFIDSFSLQAVQRLKDFAKLHLEKFKQPIEYRHFESHSWKNGIKIDRKQLQQFIYGE